jgi:dephospho-CoA kinase
VLVTAPEDVKIARHLRRIQQAGAVLSADQQAQAEADARKRIAMQIADADKAGRCDFVIENAGTPEELEERVGEVYRALTAAA